jgi:8-oxo-dGTP diphosphatase
MSELHEQPIITADVIVISNHAVLLIERGKDPQKGCWALPGGHFDIKTDKSIIACAIRELKEETHLIAQESNLKWIGYFDAKGRDPRGRYVGFCWTVEYENSEDVVNAQADDDAIKLKWFDLDALPELAFDHQEMINTYHNLYVKLMR